MEQCFELVDNPMRSDDSASFLSPGELADLTGYRRPRKQREWLDKNGIVYLTSASGRPKVLRAALAQKMGMHLQTSDVLEPDFTSLTGRE